MQLVVANQLRNDQTSHDQRGDLSSPPRPGPSPPTARFQEQACLGHPRHLLPLPPSLRTAPKPEKPLAFVMPLSDREGACPAECKGEARRLTALGDGASGGQVPVLPVHVVRATAGVVAQPDAEVLHAQGGLLEHLSRGRHRLRLGQQVGLDQGPHLP